MSHNAELKDHKPGPFSRGGRVEWQTWLLILVLYSSWVAVTALHSQLPLWMLFLLGAWIGCWHSSLQHETIHFHPTTDPGMNSVLGYPPLGLVIPYPIYRESHLEHHRVHELTDPRCDPESFYVRHETWCKLNPVVRQIMIFNNTAIGRLLIGPLVTTAQFFWKESAKLLSGDRERWMIWSLHFVMVCLILFWVMAICGMPLWKYILCFAYPGMSLLLLRSYAEHCFEEQREHRTAIVESGLFFQLLYLSNNFHYIHHKFPRLAWYQIPARYRSWRTEALRENGGYLINGYRELFRRYSFRRKEDPVYPPTTTL